MRHDRAAYIFLRPATDGSWPLVLDLLGRVIVTCDGEAATAFTVACAERGVPGVAPLRCTMTQVARMLLRDGTPAENVPTFLAIIEQAGEDLDTAATRAHLVADLLPEAAA